MSRAEYIIQIIPALDIKNLDRTKSQLNSLNQDLTDGQKEAVKEAKKYVETIEQQKKSLDELRKEYYKILGRIDAKGNIDRSVNWENFGSGWKNYSVIVRQDLGAGKSGSQFVYLPASRVRICLLVFLIFAIMK